MSRDADADPRSDRRAPAVPTAGRTRTGPEEPAPVAAIFDLDGLLVDSEPLWERAEIRAFARVGVSLSRADTRTTTGLRIGEVVAHWRARRPWTGASDAEVEADVVDELCGLLERTAVPLPGAARAVDLAAGAGLRLALASSSPRRVIEAALGRLGVGGRFEAVVSAEGLPHGKPHPEVYLRTAGALGVAPTRCVALEDSLNGVLAAKAARMRCVAVPAPHHREDPRFALADVVLDDLTALSAAHLTGAPEAGPAAR